MYINAIQEKPQVKEIMLSGEGNEAVGRRYMQSQTVNSLGGKEKLITACTNDTYEGGEEEEEVERKKNIDT